MKVEQVMTRNVMVCTDADTLNRAAQLMWDYDCGSIPVISANGRGELVGVVTDRDLAMAAYTQGKPLYAIPVTTAMAHKVIACHVQDGISQAEALMRENRVRRLPVLDSRPLGRDALAERPSPRGATRGHCRQARRGHRRKRFRDAGGSLSAPHAARNSADSLAAQLDPILTVTRCRGMKVIIRPRCATCPRKCA